MQADIDEVVHVKFEGDIVKLLTKVDMRTYKPYLYPAKQGPIWDTTSSTTIMARIVRLHYQSAGIYHQSL